MLCLLMSTLRITRCATKSDKFCNVRFPNISANSTVRQVPESVSSLPLTAHNRSSTVRIILSHGRYRLFCFPVHLLLLSVPVFYQIYFLHCLEQIYPMIHFYFAAAFRIRSHHPPSYCSGCKPCSLQQFTIFMYIYR